MPKLVGVNEETGEAVEITVIEPAKTARKPGQMVGYTQTWVAELLTHRPALTANELLVFLAIASRMDHEDGIAVYPLEEIRAEVGFSHATSVSAAVRRLIDAGLLRRRDQRTVWVNPTYAWRGKGGSRTIAIWRWQNPTG